MSNLFDKTFRFAHMGTNALSSNQNMSFVTNLMGQIKTKRKENCFLHASSIEMLFTTFVGYFYLILLIKSQHLSIGLFCHMNGNSFTYLKKKKQITHKSANYPIKISILCVFNSREKFKLTE